MVAKQAADQADFINEQRGKTNLRETAESVKSTMRHEYLKFVREGKNQTINLGNGDIQLDQADIELYWIEYREMQFKGIENTRAQIENTRTGLLQQLAVKSKEISSGLSIPNFAAAVMPLFVLLSGLSNFSLVALLCFLVGLAIETGRSIAANGIPSELNGWLPLGLSSFPVAVLGYFLGAQDLMTSVVCLIIILGNRKLKKFATKVNPKYKSILGDIDQTERQLNELPSQDLLAAVRRLG